MSGILFFHFCQLPPVKGTFLQCSSNHRLKGYNSCRRLLVTDMHEDSSCLLRANNIGKHIGFRRPTSVMARSLLQIVRLILCHTRTFNCERLEFICESEKGIYNQGQQFLACSLFSKKLCLKGTGYYQSITYLGCVNYGAKYLNNYFSFAKKSLLPTFF